MKRSLSISMLLFAFLGLSFKTILAAPLKIKRLQENSPSATDLINAVNSLRTDNGLPVLNVHPVLMEVAQWEVDAIANGSPGHTRPGGLTLGQWLISLGYPLAGDLSLDGYRSENFVLGIELSVRDAIEMWLGDEPHTNTMLSPDRSDIGGAVASKKDEWGNLVYYYVIETALQTSSGQQQYSAQAILTGIPLTQLAIYGDATQAAQALSVPQYIIPVSVNTARPDGDVFHEVKYGQTLWSVATTYGVKIDQIKRLNNLTSTDLYPNQILLIQKGATQPPPRPTEVVTRVIHDTPFIPSSTSTLTPTPKSDVVNTGTIPHSDPSEAGVVIGIVILAVSLAGLLSWLPTRKKV